MEKIKEALLKAKSTSQQAKTTSQTTTVAQTPAKSSSAQVGEDTINAISYTSTKQIQLSRTHLEKNRIVAFDKTDATVSIFDTLRTQVLQKMQEHNWHSIGVLSATPGSGKTFVAINLAMSIANQPQKTVLLADFDLRKPRVAKYLGIESEQSLNEYLSGAAELQDVLINPGMPRLVILPTARPVQNPAETLSSARVNSLMEDIRNRYESRVVIYDLPPVLNLDDALIMMRKVDCVLFVVGNGLVKEAEIEEAMHHIPKEKLLGVVLNRAEIKADAYYY
jgi:capsular exopolysaccharide synthesis family protein